MENFLEQRKRPKLSWSTYIYISRQSWVPNIVDKYISRQSWVPNIVDKYVKKIL